MGADGIEPPTATGAVVSGNRCTGISEQPGGFIGPQPRSPTTTGKIERFHRSLRAEFLSDKQAFTSLKTAQQALDEWVDYYNTARPHQSLQMTTPVERFTPDGGPIAIRRGAIRRSLRCISAG